MHHHIVGLEEIHLPYPKIDPHPPHTVTTTSYSTTTPSQLPSRITEATILITTTVQLNASSLSPENTPHLQAIAVLAAGTDHVDLEAAKARGIRVFNCPGASAEVVANHALGLYFAARRRTVCMHAKVVEEPSEWKDKGSVVGYMRDREGRAPLVVGDEVAGILGYGGIGKRVAAFCQALGMRVLISARKDDDANKAQQRTLQPDIPSRVPFTEVLKRSTVLFVLVPKSPSTLNLISTPELSTMTPQNIIINISRGGIVDEHAIAAALLHEQIAGYATDVFATEPVEGESDSPLLSPAVKDTNLTLSPHAAWFGERTRQNLSAMVKRNIESFIAGSPENLVV